MKDFNIKATLNTDTGKKSLKFKIAYAESYEEATKRAVQMIMLTEGCPEIAISSINVKPI